MWKLESILGSPGKIFSLNPWDSIKLKEYYYLHFEEISVLKKTFNLVARLYTMGKNAFSRLFVLALHASNLVPTSSLPDSFILMINCPSGSFISSKNTDDETQNSGKNTANCCLK